MNPRIKTILSLALAFSLLPVLTLADTTFPSFPMAFWGNATLNDLPMFAGYTIRAYCGENLIGEITMVESGTYGYNEATKNKLLVSNCDGDILFKYLPSGASEALTGSSEIKYIDGFISGTVIQKDLNFSITTPPSTPPSSGGGGGGGGGGGSTPPVTSITTAGEVTATISNGGKTTAISSENTKASVELPANAVNTNTEIKITAVDKNTAAPVVIQTISVGEKIIGGFVYNFTATAGGNSVSTFLQPVTLTFTYTNEQIKGLNESTLKIHYWSEKDSKWVDLDTKIDKNSKTLTTTVTHFTLFAVMGRKGDMDGNGKVDFDDFAGFALLYGKTYTDDNLKIGNIPVSWGDFDSDSDVDFDDFATFALIYGK